MSAHEFGGDWTEEKLRDLSKYMSAYTTILKKTKLGKQPLRYDYIDCFAGTGTRKDKDAPPEEAAFKDGSALIALKSNPPFDNYVFIDLDPDHSAQLETLKSRFYGRRIEVHTEDANAYLQRECSKNWERRRALMFLDPYATELKWPSIEAIAQTEGVDLWVLFPVGVAVNRFLQRDGTVKDWAKEKLTNLFGLPFDDWYHQLYVSTGQLTLDYEEERKKINIDGIGNFFLKRLDSVFPHTAPTFRTLKNSAGLPIFQLFFACANPDERIGQIAVKIAKHILTH